MTPLQAKRLVAAASIALSLASISANAVRLDADGLGQALIYPYYTVRSSNGNSWNTALAVINTRANAKVVKVRFREGKHARIAWEANVYLGPHDAWTAGVVMGSDGAPHVVSNDASCIDPPLSGTDGGAFSTAAFSGAASDGAGSDIDRTFEGFAEAIEMGELAGGTAAAVTFPTDALGRTLHGNCAAVVGKGKTRNIAAPSGGLSGSAFLINVNSGLSTPYQPAALADLAASAFYSDVGDQGTDYDSPQVTPLSVTLIGPDDPNALPSGFGASPSGYLLRSTWSRGVDAVTAVLMSANVHNEYVLDGATQSNTDWVLTMPTARFYTDQAAAAAPFNVTFGASGACESVQSVPFNREQVTIDLNAGSVFPEAPPPGPPLQLCWAANVVSYRNGSANAYNTPRVPSLVLAASNVLGIDIPSAFQDGFAWLFLNATAPLNGGVFPPDVTRRLTSLPTSTAIDLATGNVIAGAHRFEGLPVVGFGAWKFDNGLLSCNGQACKGSFGAAYSHHFIPSVSRIAP